MDGLPKFVVIKSMYIHKCMRYISQSKDMQTSLKFSGEDATRPDWKFEIREAISVKGLVNILCCSNGKYLVQFSPEDRWIVATAEQPQEDQADWSCTLFELIILDGEKDEFRFRHVNSKQYACLWWPPLSRLESPSYGCLCLGSKEVNKDPCDVFKIIDWESLEKPTKPINSKEKGETTIVEQMICNVQMNGGGKNSQAGEGVEGIVFNNENSKRKTTEEGVQGNVFNDETTKKQSGKKAK